MEGQRVVLSASFRRSRLKTQTKKLLSWVVASPECYTLIHHMRLPLAMTPMPEEHHQWQRTVRCKLQMDRPNWCYCS